MLPGCAPFEVFYGRVSNSVLHPQLTAYESDNSSESDEYPCVSAYSYRKGIVIKINAC